jgi:hypothetical protein
MKQLGPLQALWMSFYSQDLYRDVARNWKGIALLYLMLLLALSWLPTPVRWFLGLRAFASAEAPAITRQLPAVRIQNGIMEARPSGRHELLIPDTKARASDEPLFVIDDSIDVIPADLSVNAVMLTRREFGIIRPSRHERRVYTLTPAADMDVTPDEVRSFLESLQFWVPPIGYLIALTGSVLFRLLQALVYAAIGQGLARRWNAVLDHRSAVRLAVVAMTPVVVIRTLLWMGPGEPAWYLRWPAAFAITVMFLRFGVRAATIQPSSAPATTTMNP